MRAELENPERKEAYNKVKKKLKDTIDNSRVINKDSIQRFKNYHLLNAGYKCNYNLLTSFGLIGKFSAYGKRNENPLYCPGNNYTCCSDSQLESSLASFGKGLVNLRTDLEPVIELALSLKTRHFVGYFGRNYSNQICSKIIKKTFGKDPLDQNFNIKKFLNSYIK